MMQVIRQIKERNKIDLECKGIKYDLFRLDDSEYDLLRDNSLPIEEPDFRFYHSLFRSKDGRGNELNLAEIFVTLESIFSKTSNSFDRHRGSFSFPVLLLIKKPEQTFFYLMNISDRRGSVDFRLYKIIHEGLEEKDYNNTQKPFEDEFSRHEINYFISYFYGTLISHFRIFKRNTPVKPFIRTINSSGVLYGYKDDGYFELDCESSEECEAEIKLFEEKYGKESKSETINALLQGIISESA
ncbi:hypothetical protein DSM106972_009510 [Dulcicalothrix desertica PCC 7102]|uniref:Uncharacterized protein n=1 Tax=Dulcicalothrix desertica PCC 7102 TaxID=232991 RepID=A0A3S1DF92_9CYAN|nr:hypothetical protein [Dulcicalothrix desertica]RUT08898.1 hypothetical protein DSM106972_009510 [Dulcicalothrix desertica PCC 7102]TWH49785.1 hypothetical protein CAL7102_04017 [Dulcicalothrix desertica PCC 7102]